MSSQDIATVIRKRNIFCFRYPTPKAVQSCEGIFPYLIVVTFKFSAIVLRRYSCCRLCWLGREHGIQSIPSASSYMEGQTPRSRMVEGWNRDRKRNHEQSLRMQDKVRLKSPVTPLPPFTFLDAQGERRRSGFAVSCLHPRVSKEEAGRCVSRLGVRNINNALVKRQWSDKASVQELFDMCGLWMIRSNSLRA